jgi:phosphoglycolate phosphatase-like HAD superfamily hydrolase
MTVGAILFDFDGVLAESARIKAWAFEKLYEGFEDRVREGAIAHHAAHAGISRLEKIRFVHREYLGIDLSEAEVAEWGLRYNALVEDAVVAAPWVPGARDFVAAHAERIPLYVVSGTPEDELRRIAEKRAMSHWFKGIFGSPRRKEPIIRDILAAENLPPDRVLFIGDATTDSDAAAATDLRFLGRVAPGEPDPFPPGTPLIPDLTGLSIA